MGEYELHLGDCLEYMRGMEDGSVDAVVTDPPYGVGIADWDAAMPSQEVLSECLRVSRGPVVWFGSAMLMLDFSSYTPRPDRMLIWAPKFLLGQTSRNGYFYRYHPVAIWRPIDQDAVAWDVLNDASDGHNWWNHPGTKPVSIMRKLVRATSAEGDTVLDPYSGSGTTGVACMQLGRNFIGCEIDEGYFKIAEKRIREASQQPPLFVSEPQPKPRQARLSEAGDG